MDDYPFGEILREIGRGKEGARDLTRDKAQALFERLFSGRLGEMETGAMLLALRVKGESLDEIDGAIAALSDPGSGYLRPVQVDDSRPVVSIPSYNGARQTPNLTALLACLLSGAGVQVVIHGIGSDPRRTVTADIMRAMGLTLAESGEQAAAVLERHDPVFVPIAQLSPVLARLLSLRARLGVRNVAHTLVKLINPTTSERCMRITCFTHPDFNRLQHQFFMRNKASAMVLRGTEGEVVASVRRAAQIDWMHEGSCDTVVEAQTTPMLGVPNLPSARDVHATALWIQSVLSGECPVPHAIAEQVDAVLNALGMRAASLA